MADRLVLDGQRSNTRRLRRCPDEREWRGLPIRCKRRTCPVCGPKRARQLARVLLLDAACEQPTHCLTLTTRSASNDAQRFREGMARVFSGRDGMRSRWPCEYFAKIEFTTGAAATSGGHRRMHAHLLVKGLADVDHEEARLLARRQWKAVTGAWRIELAELRTPAAAIQYLGLHHAKASQLPPSSWRGMVERSSRGYWSQPIKQLREEARRQLWAEALVWSTGLDPVDARMLVDGTADQRQLDNERLREAQAALREIGRLVMPSGAEQSNGAATSREPMEATPWTQCTITGESVSSRTPML